MHIHAKADQAGLYSHGLARSGGWWLVENLGQLHQYIEWIGRERENYGARRWLESVERIPHLHTPHKPPMAASFTAKHPSLARLEAPSPNSRWNHIIITSRHINTHTNTTRRRPYSPPACLRKINNLTHRRSSNHTLKHTHHLYLSFRFLFVNGCDGSSRLGPDWIP